MFAIILPILILLQSIYIDYIVMTDFVKFLYNKR